jgi:hypothetical protein
MPFVCWMTKATNIHSEYVIPIAFPRQKWLRERASILPYTYIACLILSQALAALSLHLLLCVWNEMCSCVVSVYLTTAQFFESKAGSTHACYVITRNTKQARSPKPTECVDGHSARVMC